MRRKIEVIKCFILCFLLIVGITNVQAMEKCGYIQQAEQIKLEAFADKFFNEYMEKYQIPGAAISIIQDGKVLLKKGYGYANLETKEPFTTEDTYFSIASITKTFTAMAIMKLVQEGKVELDEAIQTYLPTLRLENPYKEPVTVRHLLTHTGGIDSSYTEDLSYEKTNNEVPHNLVNLLNKRKIYVVNKPGEFVEYSSYGTVLLGAIVEEISGISCEDYYKENIFKPLDMNHTEILNPNVKRIQGYICNQGNLTPGELGGYFKLYPEGGIVSSIEDMNHYIQMILDNGIYNDKNVIEPNVVEEMLKRQASFDLSLPGMGFGFAEYENKGVKSMGHAGYAPEGTLSEMVIYPQQHIGTFIVVNQGSNNNVQVDFREAFISEFLEDKIPSIEKKEESKAQSSKEVMTIDPKQVEGVYRFSDYSKTNLYKANVFGDAEVKVKSIDEKNILISGKDDFTFEPYEKEAEWVEGLKYKIKDKMDYVVFKQDEKENVCYMAETENSSHGIYEKIKWYEQARWQMPFFISALVIYLIQLIGVLVVFIKRKVKKTKCDKLSYESKIISGIAFLNLGFFIYSMGFWGNRLRYSIPFDIILNLTMPIISCLFTILLGGRMFYSRERLKKEKLYKKVYVIGMFILSIVFVLFLNYWNFIGYKL